MTKRDRLDKYMERKLGSYRFDYVKRMESSMPAGMLEVIAAYRLSRILSNGFEIGEVSDIKRKWYLESIQNLRGDIMRLLNLDKVKEGEK